MIALGGAGLVLLIAGVVMMSTATFVKNIAYNQFNFGLIFVIGILNYPKFHC